MNIDYLIIGQGISGTLLSRILIKGGRKVIVIDDGHSSTASKVASGIINPVTGKRLVKTWLIEQLMPFAWSTYRDIEDDFDITLIRKCNILDFYQTRDEAQTFNERALDQKDYLHQSTQREDLAEYFRFNYGVGEIDPCFLIDIRKLLGKWRAYLAENNSLLQTRFSFDDCVIATDHVTYKNIKAQKIIFCDGAVCADNPYFDRLPWSKDKGEALIVSIPGLPANNIYKQGINIVHWYNDLFWIGATHDWKFTDMLPSVSFREKTEEHLNYWLKLPYEIIDHLVAARPVNVERRPFVGLHPSMPSLGIFNGMGTKGCSVVPYFAHHFVQHLVSGNPLMPDVDIKRFERILSR